jgi:peptidoglycan/xylan/chitin deacetylase (PgdA/CDA1 family)
MTHTLNAAVLTYHSISEGPAPLCIPPSVFAAQMNWLKANVHVVSLALLVESLTQDKPMPPRTVALTFDDGFSDFYSVAAPVLRHLELSAVVFLPVSHCGKLAPWSFQTGGKSLMTWEQIRELTEQGVHIGSHGMSHSRLINRTDAELTYEMSESKRLIEAETGQEVRFFCYPYGYYDERICKAVPLYYSGGACTTDLREITPEEDCFALPRIDVHYMRNISVFRSMFTGRFRAYVYARRIGRNIVSWKKSAPG